MTPFQTIAPSIIESVFPATMAPPSAQADGAAQQFLELMFTAALSMAAYVLFKACEHRLVQRLCDPKEVQ